MSTDSPTTEWRLKCGEGGEDPAARLRVDVGRGGITVNKQKALQEGRTDHPG